MIAGLDPVVLLTIAVALGLGGFVKGATGAGTPLVAVPVMAAFFDVTLAILVMVVPNFVMNVSQVWSYRADIKPPRMAILLSIGSVPGMFVGTYLLTRAPEEVLFLVLGLLLAFYILLRLVDPKFSISQPTALRLSLPVGILGGVMQGAAGTSGPLALLFLSTQNLARPVFIGTISAFFLANSMVQAPALWWEGLLTWHWLWISTLALVPVWLCLPLGNRVGKRLSQEAFNRWVLILLAALAIRLLWRGLA